ncbi:MAG: hypothetical protein PWR30_72 [Candidatus Woesearchaeota archaeon]|nr:hypothetical protein [Candidatus Woesearchaeota archaeon]
MSIDEEKSEKSIDDEIRDLIIESATRLNDSDYNEISKYFNRESRARTFSIAGGTIAGVLLSGIIGNEVIEYLENNNAINNLSLNLTNLGLTTLIAASGFGGALIGKTIYDSVKKKRFKERKYEYINELIESIEILDETDVSEEHKNEIKKGLNDYLNGKSIDLPILDYEGIKYKSLF